MSKQPKVTVIGGGLAGLTAAAYLARAGQQVILYERAAHPGGRAYTQSIEGFRLNLGPHALYRAGAAASAFKELGVPYSGRPVPAKTYLALFRGELHSLPSGPFSLLRSSLLSIRGKAEMLRFLASLTRLNTAELDYVTERDWLDRAFSSTDARQMMEAFIRLATYTNSPEILSAGAALAQLKVGLRGVDYLDDGWISLVEGLYVVSSRQGAEIKTGTSIQSLPNDGGNVIFAGAPDSSQGTTPVLVSSLDLCLDRLPEPGNTFALGIDEPFYFSVHSAWARLAPAGGAMIHVAKYGKGDRSELETILDRVQKGWRDHVVHARFMPNLTVTHAVVTAEGGGLRGRTPVDGSNRPNVYFAGDWVGAEGMLTDAAVASGKKAAEMIIKAPQPVQELQIA